MLDINLFRETPDIVRQALARPPDGPRRRWTMCSSWTRSAARCSPRSRRSKPNATPSPRRSARSKDPAERQAKIEAMRQVGDRNRRAGRTSAPGG